jgi:pyruvate dehydrogenase E1 component
MRTCTSAPRALGGYLPHRAPNRAAAATVPRSSAYARSRSQADGKEMSTTMAFVRMLTNLLKDPALGPRIVPIVADEARTFGMANLFKQVGIYSPSASSTSPRTSARCS